MKWYPVKIKVEMKYRGLHRDFTMEYQSMITNWITDLFESSDTKFDWKHIICCTYEFSTEEAAMAFKLRWI